MGTLLVGSADDGAGILAVGGDDGSIGGDKYAIRDGSERDDLLADIHSRTSDQFSEYRRGLGQLPSSYCDNDGCTATGEL